MSGILWQEPRHNRQLTNEFEQKKHMISTKWLEYRTKCNINILLDLNFS